MKLLRIGAVSFMVLFAISGSLVRVTAQPEPYQTITAPEVKSFMEGNGAVLVHTLSEIEFNIQHIPGSINIPIIEMRTTDKLPTDKTTPLIFYCMGVR